MNMENEMPITVNVGEILECDETNEVRTRGCDPCVGLIVIYVNEEVTKRCAHFSVNIAGRLTQDIINAALNPVLEAQFPLSNIKAVGFTWGGNAVDMGGDLIFNRLTDYFVEQPILVQSNENDSLTTAKLEINLLNNQNWPWTNDPANKLLAELNRGGEA
jgi:hypothetical protein